MKNKTQRELALEEYVFGEGWFDRNQNSETKGGKRHNNSSWCCYKIEELLKHFTKNRESIALNVVRETEDYYSFLRGFDYVLEEIKYILYDEDVQ